MAHPRQTFIRQGAESEIIRLAAYRRARSVSPQISLSDINGPADDDRLGRAVEAQVAPGMRLDPHDRLCSDAVIEGVIATLLAPLLAVNSDLDAAFDAFSRAMREQWQEHLRPQGFLYLTMVQQRSQRAQVLGRLLKVPESWDHLMALMALACCGQSAPPLLGETACTITPADDATAWGNRSEILVPEQILAEMVNTIMEWFTKRGATIFPRY